MEVRILQPTMSSSKMVDSDILSGIFALHPLGMTSSGVGYYYCYMQSTLAILTLAITDDIQIHGKRGLT